MEVDTSVDVRSFRFRSECQYDEVGGYTPGAPTLAGTAASGAVRTCLEMTRRACLIEFVVRATGGPGGNHSLYTTLENSSEVKAILTIQGDLIGGAAYHKLVITVPRLKYRAVQIAADGDVLTYQIQSVIFYDGLTSNPFSVQVVNTTAAYTNINNV